MPRPGRAAAAGAAAAGAAAAAIAWRALWQEPRSDRVRERDLALAGWPEELAGLRVALLSDLHAGAPHVREERIERLVAAVNARRPDLVLLLGDYIDPEVPFGGPVAPGPSPRASAPCARRAASSPCSATTTGTTTAPGCAPALRDGRDRGARERARDRRGRRCGSRASRTCATAGRTSGTRCATCRPARP